MADFNPPFAQNGERRLPSSTEQNLGLGCDPVQLRELLNGMFNLHQGQFKSIADEAGVTPNHPGDHTLLKRAVLELIASATGEGDVEGFVLFSQARTRLPIFPDVINGDGRLFVTSPSSGTVRVPGGSDFLHRGIFLVTTAQTDFPTDPSKTYHLRWNPTDGFVLRDLASGTYNPGSLAETNIAFDSTFDDMLVARIVTNSSNVATITNLYNRHRLLAEVEKTTYEVVVGTGAGGGRGPDTAPVHTINWARRPRCNWQQFATGPATNLFIDPVANVWFEATRYTCRPQVVGVYTNNSMTEQGTIDGTYRVVLEA